MVERYEGNATIRQQIGETSAMVRLLHDQLKEFREDSKRLQDSIAGELRNVRGEARRLDQIVTHRLEELSRKVSSVEAAVSQLRSDLSDTRTELSDIKEPLSNLIDLRNRLFSYGVVLASIATVLWFVVGPFISAWLTGVAHKVTGG